MCTKFGIDSSIYYSFRVHTYRVTDTTGSQWIKQCNYGSWEDVGGECNIVYCGWVSTYVVLLCVCCWDGECVIVQRNLTEMQKDAIVKDFNSLNLTMYVGEMVRAVADCFVHCVMISA